MSDEDGRHDGPVQAADHGARGNCVLVIRIPDRAAAHRGPFPGGVGGHACSGRPGWPSRANESKRSVRIQRPRTAGVVAAGLCGGQRVKLAGAVVRRAAGRAGARCRRRRGLRARRRRGVRPTVGRTAGGRPRPSEVSAAKLRVVAGFSRGVRRPRGSPAWRRNELVGRLTRVNILTRPARGEAQPGTTGLSALTRDTESVRFVPAGDNVRCTAPTAVPPRVQGPSVDVPCAERGTPMSLGRQSAHVPDAGGSSTVLATVTAPLALVTLVSAPAGAGGAPVDLGPNAIVFDPSMPIERDPGHRRRDRDPAGRRPDR